MYLYGASGHGRVIKEIIEASGGVVRAFIDDNMAVDRVADLEVLHSATGLHPLIVSIGSNAARRRVAERTGGPFGMAVHPAAVVSPSARIGEGTVVMAGAVINAGAVVGRHCIVNTGASIDHDCVVADFCHIAPHAALCGGVHVGEETLIGVGASVIPCINIGRRCTVGAGATVINHIKDDMTVVGTPAKCLKIKGGWRSELTLEPRHKERRLPYAA